MTFAIGVIVVAVVGATSPAWAGRITPGQGFGDVPGYWREAAAWLERDQEEHPGVALLVPGSSFGTYVWGTPRDEPMQALAGSPWAVRNAVPLTPAGNIRMLDEIERPQRRAGSAGPRATSAGPASPTWWSATTLRPMSRVRPQRRCTSRSARPKASLVSPASVR